MRAVSHAFDLSGAGPIYKNKTPLGFAGRYMAKPRVILLLALIALE
jgi:hypothetical protein